MISPTLARFSPAQAQAGFRILLQALATPGRIQPGFRELAGVPAALVPALVLADFTCSVAVVTGSGPRLQEDLCGLTGALPAVPEHADLVMVLDPRAATPALIGALRRGTALAPERSARVGIAVEQLGGGPVVLALDGPGVDGRIEMAAGGPPAETFRALAQINSHFSTGIDAWLFAPDGRVAGLPRSTRIAVEELV